MADTNWLNIAKQAFDKSTTYVDANYRQKWDDALRHFQSRHHASSKYHSSAYKYRTKMFRPKTRAAVRNNEAASVAAFFSNEDIVTIEPMNPNDPIQKASAEVMQELLAYRLTKTIPWFLTCIGGFQDSQVIGVVASYQYWDYREKEETYYKPQINELTGQPVMDQESGDIAMEEIKQPEPYIDKPAISILPVENIRLHPSADWTDPINSSPFLIRLVPMYVMDVKQRMEEPDRKTNQPKWRKYDDGVIKAAIKQRYDPTKTTREESREDKHDQTGTDELGEFDVVWCHENFVKMNGNDYVYWTLGTDEMLSNPKPIEEVYFHGERPVVMGYCVLETHKIFPEGIVGLGKNVQIELNENVNQRLDNVKLVLNKRWIVKRGSMVDLKSITRNVPGSVTMVNDVQGDVLPVDFNDITPSSYHEQDRLNLDFDELIGMFSGGTIQSNRQLNETVGGMKMLQGNTNMMTEYTLRMFAETWMEPVMRQLVKLEQKYETDMTVLAIAAEKAQVFQKYGINQVTDELLNQELTTTVNVGMGATNPIMRMQNFLMGINAIIQILGNTPPGTINPMEVAKEIFGYLGFKDGQRFFVQAMGGQDPEKMQMQQIIQQLQAAMQELQQQLKSKQMDNQTKLLTTKMQEDGDDRRTAAELKTKIALKEMDLSDNGS
jgi:hypothetical protein